MNKTGRWINAWGQKVWQAGWERWYAVDDSGEIYAYFKRPEKDGNMSGWAFYAKHPAGQVFACVGEAQDDVEWDASLTPAADMLDWEEYEQETHDPAAHEVNGYTVPAPETEPLAHGQEYYVADPTADYFCEKIMWDGDDFNMQDLDRGLVFMTEQAAVENAKAMCHLDPYQAAPKL